MQRGHLQCWDVAESHKCPARKLHQRHVKMAVVRNSRVDGSQSIQLGEATECKRCKRCNRISGQIASDQQHELATYSVSREERPAKTPDTMADNWLWERSLKVLNKSFFNINLYSYYITFPNIVLRLQIFNISLPIIYNLIRICFAVE